MLSVLKLVYDRLIYKRDHLLEHVDALLKNFDAELHCLRHEKFQLDIDMKNADLRYEHHFRFFLSARCSRTTRDFVDE